MSDTATKPKSSTHQGVLLIELATTDGPAAKKFMARFSAGKPRTTDGTGHAHTMLKLTAKTSARFIRKAKP